MGRGRQNSGRRRRTPKYVLSEIRRRRLQSNIARAIRIQRGINRRRRGGLRIENKQLSFGKMRVDCIERYIESSGITGTTGEATNFGQAVGSVLSQIRDSKKKLLKPKMMNSDVTETSRGNAYFLLSGSAFTSVISTDVYNNILSACLLTQTFLSMIYSWEQRLLKGKYCIYLLQDFSQPMISGEYPPFGISTEKYRLKEYQYDIMLEKSSITKWMTIQGRHPFPTQKANHKVLQYPTIRQG